MWGLQGVPRNIYFLKRIVKILQSLRQHWAATIWRRGMVCSGLWKTQFFPNTLYNNPIGRIKNSHKISVCQREGPSHPMYYFTFLCPLFVNALKLLNSKKAQPYIFKWLFTLNRISIGHNKMGSVFPDRLGPYPYPGPANL